MRSVRPLLATMLLGVAGLAPGAPAAAQGPPDDPGFPRQWGLERIGAPTAWAIARGAGISIAVVDSGISSTHVDLGGKLEAIVDCVGSGPCVEGAGTDNAGHGTHVAGIAAADTGNGQGVAGVAPDARLLSVRALDCQGQDGCDARGTESDVAEAIRWSVDHGAEVINLSLGSLTQQILGPGGGLRALQYAWDAGVIPVIVSGNDALLGSLVDLPAVVVAATNRNDGAASYSSGVGNVRWAVAAPGGEGEAGLPPGSAGTCASDTPVGILSTYRMSSIGGDGYACIAGTSMAAPHVSGALAVLRSAGLRPLEAVERLLATADDLGPAGHDNQFGSGRINLARAVEGLAATGGGDVVVPDPSTTAVEPSEPVVTVAPTVALPPDPAADSTATTAPIVSPGVTTPPVATESAVSAGALPVGGDESLPALPLTAAVLLVVGAASGHAWRYLAVTPWARRTPER